LGLLKHILSISLLISWLLFTYSRMWTYRTCPAMPVLALPTVNCDCERQPPEATDNGQPAAGPVVSKQKPEDVFARSILFALPDHFTHSASIESVFLISRIFPGFPLSFFQPPRC